MDSFIHYLKDTSKDLLKRSYEHRYYYAAQKDHTLVQDKSLFTSDIINRVKLDDTFLKAKAASDMFDSLNQYKLTSRESTCAIYLRSGLRAKEIAQRMNISPRTVEKHIQSLKDKTQTMNINQLMLKLLWH